MSLLVTGACGSLGRAILRAALAQGVERIVALDHHEFGTYRAREELGNPPAVRWIIGDVRNRDRVERAAWGVSTVIHTAAYKWVESAVANIDELAAVNVGGTAAVIEAARKAKVARVLVITSDKAVDPTTSYGATKMLAEQHAVQANAWTYPQGTAVACLRFGNLLWSRGSVAHRWRWAAKNGAAFEIVDPTMTRFGIRLSAAGALALWGAQHLRGGEIFVPELPAYRLLDLCEAIDLTRPRRIVGHRGPGEKAHEVLLSVSEGARAVQIESPPWARLAVLEPESPSWTREPWAGPLWKLERGWRSDQARLMPDLALDEMDAE